LILDFWVDIVRKSKIKDVTPSLFLEGFEKTLGGLALMGRNDYPGQPGHSDVGGRHISPFARVKAFLLEQVHHQFRLDAIAREDHDLIVGPLAEEIKNFHRLSLTHNLSRRHDSSWPRCR
jgi:hypothetical protein